jgi:Protein of unknown function (DUF3034)
MHALVRLLGTGACLAALALPVAATAGGRLLATGGATAVEGAAGGGIVPWALLAGYGTGEENGGTAFFTRVDTGDYTLNSYGAAFTWRNRVELSIARQEFDLGSLNDVLGLPAGTNIRQDVYGAKLRLMGDAVYTTAPQLALGVQYKRNRDFAIPAVAGARDDSGVDVYLSAGKLWLGAIAGYNLWTNLTVRATEANQLGLLGFGGDRNDDHEIVAEGSVALFLDPNTVIGVEYRGKPDNLGFAAEDDWSDIFFGYFPNKHLALVLAYAELGSIATLDDQNGLYLSVQASF